MRRLIDELRQSIAEWLLYRSAVIAPHTEDGKVIVRAVANAFGDLRDAGTAAKEDAGEAEGLRPLTDDEIEAGSYLLTRAKDDDISEALAPLRAAYPPPRLDDGIDMDLLGKLCREEPDDDAKREVDEMMDKLNGGS